MVYTILIQNSDKTQNREYSLDIEPLYKKNDVYDTLNIDSTGKVTITKRIGIDATLDESYILPTPIETEYGELTVELYEGVNYISLKDDNNTIFSVKYILKNDFTDTYATKVELNTAITQTSTYIMSEVNKKVGEDELGTQIVQNYESVQIAWNQISDFIQFMIYKNNTSIAIKDDSDNVIMWLDKTGLHFNEDGTDTRLGNMAVEKVDNNNFISFSLPIQYNSSLSNGMAWGVTTTNDNKFHPILYLKDFEMGPQNSDATYGQLVLESCDLVFNGMETGIQSGNVMIHGNVFQGITFEDTDGNILLAIYPGMGTIKQSINMLGGEVQFYENQAGTFTFRIGSDINNCAYIENNGNIYTKNADIYVDGYVSAKGFNTISSSLAEKKKNIKKLRESAIDIVKNTDIYEYNYKEENKNTKKHIGFIIGDTYNYSQRLTTEKNDNADIYSMVSVAYKAIQEQQEEIEELKKEIEKLKEK